MNTLWEESDFPKKHSTLDGDYEYDAVVIGGGMCGMLTAYKLSKVGMKTALVEAGRIGRGQTRGTTAKITICHGEIFRDIERKFGTDSLRIYAETETASVKEYVRIAESENIDCDMRILPAYLYAVYGERHIMAEYEAAQRVGVNCTVTVETQLPFEVKAALRVEDQAEFNPLKFIHGIEKGFDIYENTVAKEIHGSTVECEGGKIKAKYIVSATNYPSPYDIKGLFPIKLHRRMAHVCTFKGTDELDGMYIGIDGGYNYRSYGDVLIVSGENHVSGLGTGGAYERIKKNTLSHFKNASPHLSWSAEDGVTLDGLPYVGRIKNTAAKVYTAVGLGTWGMTGAMTGASLICDMICGRDNPAFEMYSVNRFDFRASSDELSGMIGRAFDGIAMARVRTGEDELRDLPPDHGIITRYRGKKSAVYRDRDGNLHVSSPYCPHLKCELKWNGDDKTWDCPCHGSRFDYDGKLLSGPADHGI